MAVVIYVVVALSQRSGGGRDLVVGEGGTALVGSSSGSGSSSGVWRLVYMSL